MGRRRAFAAFLILLCGVAAGPASLPLREARWTAGEPRALPYLLNIQPPDCSVARKKERALITIGRVAFNDPLLLGGQAARAGLSCASCHRNGRDNPHFTFPGLSGPPGTADVTSSLMSRKRGDGIHNPVPIPDLAGERTPPKVSRTTPGSLEAFIRGLIVEEFDGPEPTAKLVSGIAAWIRSQRPGECAKRATQKKSVTDDLRLYADAIASAERLAGEGEQATAVAMLSGARSTLGMIDEYFSLAGLEPERALTGKQAEAINEAMIAMRAGRPATLVPLRKQWPLFWATLQRSQDRSLYNPEVIAAQLGVEPPIMISGGL